MSKEFLVKGKTLTKLTEWLNSEDNADFKKENKKNFTVGDVQSYVKRGYMPAHMGGNVIEQDNKIAGVKIYNIVK